MIQFFVRKSKIGLWIFGVEQNSLLRGMKPSVMYQTIPNIGKVMGSQTYKVMAVNWHWESGDIYTPVCWRLEQSALKALQGDSWDRLGHPNRPILRHTNVKAVNGESGARNFSSLVADSTTVLPGQNVNNEYQNDLKVINLKKGLINQDIS